MTRPLLIIFLTIFVNLIGFGIIIPLLRLAICRTAMAAVLSSCSAWPGPL